MPGARKRLTHDHYHFRRPAGTASEPPERRLRSASDLPASGPVRSAVAGKTPAGCGHRRDDLLMGVRMFERFLEGFQLLPPEQLTGVTSQEPRLLSADGYAALADRFAGCSFENGLYRLHGRHKRAAGAHLDRRRLPGVRQPRLPLRLRLAWQAVRDRHRTAASRPATGAPTRARHGRGLGDPADVRCPSTTRNSSSTGTPRWPADSSTPGHWTTARRFHSLGTTAWVIGCRCSLAVATRSTTLRSSTSTSTGRPADNCVAAPLSFLRELLSGTSPGAAEAARFQDRRGGDSSGT